ncbi:MAG: zinc metallopeptidase, partial [bacterium]|nr:zinc metallopeptidase [bacterium]
MYYPFFDSTFLIILPGILFFFWAQMRVNSSFKKWSGQKTSQGITGAQIAGMIIQQNGLNKVQIRSIPGDLSDNYNPAKKTLNLSESVYSSNSIAAVGVAAHEAGHALQH